MLGRVGGGGVDAGAGAGMDGASGPAAAGGRDAVGSGWVGRGHDRWTSGAGDRGGGSGGGEGECMRRCSMRWRRRGCAAAPDDGPGHCGGSTAGRDGPIERPRRGVLGR